MNGGNRVVGLWPDRQTDVRADARPIDHDEPEGIAMPVDDEEETPSRDWARLIVTFFCVAAAIAWIALVLSIRVPMWMAAQPMAEQLAIAIAAASPPLAIIGLIYTLAMRGSRVDARRYLQTSAGLRAENARLEATLAHVTTQILAGRAAVAETSDALLALGDDTTHRMRSVAEAMRAEVDSVGQHTQALRSSAASARADVAVLLADLPKAHSESRRMVGALEAAGLAAHEAAGSLDAQLASLAARGREADEIAGNAAQKLAAHLSRVESVSAAAADRLTLAATQMTGAVDAALDHAAQASEATRQGLEAQGTAMIALVDQAQAALRRTGNDSAAAIASRVGEAGAQIETMAARLAAQSETTAHLLGVLRDGLDHLDARFSALDQSSEGRGERLSAALAALANHAASLTGALERGTGTADVFISRTEMLMTALDATAREIDETLPAAFDRVDARATASQAAIARATPEVARIEGSASAALDRLMEAEALLAKQRGALDDYANAADTRLSTAADTARALTTEIATADAAAQALAEGASAKLVDAMLRVRETAQTAAERASEAIARIIPEVTQNLSDATREALARTISEQVSKHIADLTSTTERALQTAQKASDRLMRQMLTIADTSAAVEARIAEARTEGQENDRDNFARRVALLIESLNSTAIDVTKVLSNDVTDSAWAAYLRGDRGVFTRRAVRLLDSGEVREIVRHYDVEPEFREQVNRYIHDFEAMLRNTLSTRDGSALSVTLLSSDMGKLYVALAQAIERLRS